MIRNELARLRCTQSWTAFARVVHLFVGLTSVTHGDDVNRLFIIVNRVDHAIITHSESPEIQLAFGSL
jgi:hypothetical protein